MRKFLVVVVFGLLIAIALFSQPVKHTFGVVNEAQSPMDAILEASNGELSDVSILAWAKLNNKFMTVDDMKNTLAQLEDSYYNTQSVPQFHIEDNYKSCEVNAKITPNKNLQLILQSYQPTEKTTELKPESYILAELACNDKNFTLPELKNEVNQIYGRYKISPELTVTYTAVVKGKISSTDAEKFIKKVKDILNLESVEQTSSADFVGVFGYSKRFKDELVLAGEKRNFTLTMRYNVADDQTYIIYGTPDIGSQD